MKIQFDPYGFLGGIFMIAVIIVASAAPDLLWELFK